MVRFHDVLQQAYGVSISDAFPDVLGASKRQQFSSFLTSEDGPATDWFKDPKSFSPWTWRKQHNYFLDRGAKFMMVYKTPTIVSTDLFDLEKFGCFQVRGFQGGSGLGYLANAAANSMGHRNDRRAKRG